MIVDAHAHIFPEVRGLTAAGPTRGLGYGRVAFGDREIQVLPPCGERTEFTPEMLLANMEWAGVDKAVLLQGPFYGELNEYVLEALGKYPDHLLGVAYFDPWAADCRVAFERIVASSGFCAVKLECTERTGLFGIHPEATLDMADIAWLWHALVQMRLVLVVDLGPVGSRSYQTSALRMIAESHPNLKVIIAHLGHPTKTDEADPELWALWLEQIDLGRLPNVWFDCASLPAFVADEDYPYPTAGRYIRLAIERIGASKVMWGTDLPGALSRATYPQLVKLAELHTQFLSAHERAMVLGDNALEVYDR